jgi:hypothetical protein
LIARRYDDVIIRTHPAFLEPDRILKVLTQLQTKARVFYREEAKRFFKTG